MCAVLGRATVFLLAQNRLLREALARILDKKADIQTVGVTALSPVAREELIRANPDVLVVDCSSETDAHFQFIHELRSSLLRLRIVLIGMDDDERTFLQAVRVGVLGYVLRDASALEVVTTVRAVVAGHAICPPHLSTSLFRYVARQWEQVPSYQVKLGLGLTSREQQLVFLIGRGMTNKEIAAELQLAEQTVRNHVHRMLRKVGANDRLAVVEMCRLQGLPV
jgi:two-component system, NarL family, response regulator DevR